MSMLMFFLCFLSCLNNMKVENGCGGEGIL